MTHRRKWVSNGAVFSPCRRWRYALWRTWGQAQRILVFVGLNPSTADEQHNDPTVTRCINFAKRWGYEGMVMLNIFAWRATDPRQLYSVPDPIGPDNDRHIQAYVEGRSVIACWGTHGAFVRRGDQVRRLWLPSTSLCFGLTKNGQPKHPLYLPGNSVPEGLPACS